MKHLDKTLSALLLLSVCLTGCATVAQPIQKTQSEIETEFLQIAADSCEKAQNENVVESFSNDEPARIIALARENAYKDYSAIYVENTGEVTVVYELDLTVCGPGYLISMQEEANHDNTGDYEHYIKLNPDGTYTWTQMSWVDETQKLTDVIFSVENGLIVSATYEDQRGNRTFEYGPVSDTDLQVLRDAVDAELERLNN